MKAKRSLSPQQRAKASSSPEAFATASPGNQTSTIADNRASTLQLQLRQQQILQQATDSGSAQLALANARPDTFQLRADSEQKDIAAQRKLDIVDAPDKSDVEFLMYASDVWDAFRIKWQDEHKGLHGTSIWSAINMMTTGIRVNNVKRTSSVTPGPGFYVDTTKDGSGHAIDFSHMAAYGEQETATDEEYEKDAIAAAKKSEAYEQQMRDAIAEGKGSNRSVVLNVWGPKEVTPREKLDQSDEHIYDKGADELVVTVKSIE